MKYIITETQYNLLTEDLGVSRATLPYTNIIYETIEKQVIKDIRSDKETKETITIGLKDLFHVYKDNVDDFIELPIEQIIIKYSYTKLDENVHPEGFVIMAFADMIGQGSKLKTPNKYIPKNVLEEIDQTLVAGFEFNVNVNKDIDDDQIEELLYDLRDSVTHECNHMYEYYNREITGSKGIDTTLSFMKRPYEMFDTGVREDVLQIWKLFLNLLYVSEPYEVRAMSQEAYSKRLRMSFEKFKETKYWDYSNRMIDFNAQDYYDYIVDLMEDITKEERDVILKTLHEYFIAYYEFSKKMVFDNPLNKKIVNTKNIMDIMKYFESTINKSGKKLQKNFMRLYALQPE
jgi:hypothetical protein